TAMGRTNDAIIYAGRVHLFVTGAASDARDLAQALPSEDSRDYGQPFAEIFKRFKGDFYAIDPMLFSPAEVIVTALDSGESFHKGHVDLKLLDASFTSHIRPPACFGRPDCRTHCRRHRLACSHADKGVRRTRRADVSD